MEINRLNQDELIYDLTIRGLPTGKVEEMRLRLRAALKVEKDGRSFVVNPYPYKFEEDTQAIHNKVEEIRGLLDAFEGDSSSSEYRKIFTKVEWALSRLGRMQPTGEDEIKEKARLRGDLVLALGTLQIKADGEEDESDSSDTVADMSMAATVLKNSLSRASLHKWEIKFSGEQGQSLNSFLERVNELAEARGITKQQLFRSAIDLFAGRALIWYRANKTQFTSWSGLIRELKKEFLPSDYDDRLLEEIRRRTQGKDETIGIYVAMMSSMFARLTEPLTEGQQLRILKRNISPFYQTQLGLTEIETIQELVELGRRLESVRFSVEAFVPPPSRRHTHLLEPDLAYVTTDLANLSTVSNPHNSDIMKCFKCGRPGHIARYCRTGLRCFGCGSLGVIQSNCRRCNSNNQPSRSNINHQTPGSSGNGSGARQ